MARDLTHGDTIHGDLTHGDLRDGGPWFSGFVDDIRGIAAPVFDFNGTVIAAIAVVGPSARITEGQIEALVPLTLRTAESISRSLGHKPYKDA